MTFYEFLLYLTGWPPALVLFLGAILIFAGASFKFGTVWDLADIARCILAFLNIPVCIVLGGAAFKALDNYVSQRKAGKDPTYVAAENGVKNPTDFWN